MKSFMWQHIRLHSHFLFALFREIMEVRKMDLLTNKQSICNCHFFTSVANKIANVSDWQTRAGREKT